MNAVVQKLLIFGEKGAEKVLTDVSEGGEVKDPSNYPLEFVFGVILDQSMPFERAWEAPFELKKRLGHLDVKKIAIMDESELKKIMAKPPAIHRYYNKMANALILACKTIIDQYDGNPLLIWSGKPRVKDLENRFSAFKMIGQKKASMAVNLLVRDWGLPIADSDRHLIDVSNDIHIRRVFIRSGLAAIDSEENIVAAARKHNPEYPGALDFPSWVIGQKWCKKTNPLCIDCILADVCPKFLDRKVHE